MSLYVTIEGCDGAGKDTLLDGLEMRIRDLGVDVVRTREPGADLPSGLPQEIRASILKSRSTGKAISRVAELMLYSADRAQHMYELVFPSLAAGKVVLSSRGVDSTMVYQHHVQGLDAGVVRRMVELAIAHPFTGLPQYPDMTLWLDIDPEVALVRLTRVREPDRFEHLEFQRKVREGYRAIARSTTRIKRIPVSDLTTPEEVLAEAMHHMCWAL
jgi:dTMP kinase